MSQLLDNLVSELHKLPGVGRRSALRLALNILRKDIEEVDRLAGAIYQFRRDIKRCSKCNNLSDTDVCPICLSTRRDRSIICVVEQVGDLLTIENTRQYNGLYHVLGGVISPMMGITPSELRIELLLESVTTNQAKEVILALPTTMEGETTQFYISRRLEGCGAKITAISRGIGYGDEIEYADPLTVAHSMTHRKSLH